MPHRLASRGLRRLAGAAGRLGLVAGLAWAGYRLAGSGVLPALTRASPPPLLAAWAAVATANLVAAARWWSLAPAGHGFARIARIHVESHFWATVVPGGVAADGYRILALQRRGACPHRTAASVVAERALGTVALLLLCGPALGLGAQWLSSRLVVSLGSLAGTLFVAVVAAAGTALWAPVRRGHLRWLPARLRALGEGLEGAFAEYRDRPARLLRALGFGLAYHGLFLTGYALAGQAMGVHLPLARWFIAVPLATLVATLPLNAWGLGVREGAIVLLLVALGAPPAKAGAVSLAVVGLQLAVGSAGGLSQLLGRRRA